jgi:hypothetical protein
MAKKKTEPPYSLSDKELKDIASDPSQPRHRRLICAAYLAERRVRRGTYKGERALNEELGPGPWRSSHGMLSKARACVKNSPLEAIGSYRTGKPFWKIDVSQEETRPGRVTNWNGKSNLQRERELLAERKTSSYPELVTAQRRFAQAAMALESIDVNSYGLSEVVLWKVEDILDDLISLGEWYDRTLLGVLGWLDGVDLRGKIEKLRNTAGRTPEEAETALRLADRLERKLEARLEALEQ